MAFPQGIYSVLIVYNNFPTKKIGTFPSRSAADKYWRRAQEALHQDQGSSNANRHPPRRICPRHLAVYSDYWHGKSPLNASGVLPTLFDANYPVPHDPTADLRPENINGERYYIRSAIQPNLFWFYDSNRKQVILSNVRRTKFTIRRKTPLPFQCRPEDDIFIGEDDIHIFVTTSEWEGDSPDVMIVKDSRKMLVAASVLSLDGGSTTDVVDAGTFKFDMFDRGFGVLDDNFCDGKEVFASARVNGGERWEFVQ